MIGDTVTGTSISVLFLFVMLVLPLFVVVTEALKKGWEVYIEAVTDSYTIAALMLTLKATVIAVLCNTILGLCAAWVVTRFQFKGKKLLTTLIDVPVTVSPIIAGLIYLLICGKVIFEKIVHPFAPISAAVSSSSVPIDSSTGRSSRKTNGKVTNMVARTIPGTAKTI